METSVILSRTFSSNGVPYKTNSNNHPKEKHLKPPLPSAQVETINMDFNITSTTRFAPTTKTNFTYLLDVDTSTTRFNNSDFFYNSTNNSDIDVFDYNYRKFNGTHDDDTWSMCKDWNPAQHDLFQTANFFFAAAFLVPGSFKQSVLLVR